MNGVKPAWANLPKRKCDDCGHSYKPKQPLREGQRGFCSDNCRKSYHKHGGAYRKLRGEMQKMLDKEIAIFEVNRMRFFEERTRKLVREELLAIVNQMWGKDVADVGAWQRAVAASQPEAVSPLPNPQRRA